MHSRRKVSTKCTIISLHREQECLIHVGEILDSPSAVRWDLRPWASNAKDNPAKQVSLIIAVLPPSTRITALSQF